MADDLPMPSPIPGAFAAFFELGAAGQLVWLGGAHELFGLASGSRLPSLSDFLDNHVHPGDRDGLARLLTGPVNQPGEQGMQVRIVRPLPQPNFVAARVWLQAASPGSVDRAPAEAFFGAIVPERPSAAWEAAESQLPQIMRLAGLTAWRLDLATRGITFVGEPHFVSNAVGMAKGVPLAWIHDAVHPSDLPGLQKANAQALESDKVVEAMARYRTVGGGWINVLSRRAAQRDAHGNVVALLGVSLDRTEQVAEAERLRQLSGHVSLAADAIGAGFWSRDLDEGTVHWDEPMRRLHDWPADLDPPAQDAWIGELVHPQDQERVQAWLQLSLLRPDGAGECRFRSARGAASQRWIHAWMRLQQQGGRRRAFGMHMDVTAQHLAELALGSERERAGYALQAAEVGVWERDLSGQDDYWNEAMYRLRGLQPSDPRPLRELQASVMDAGELQRLLDTYIEHLKHGEPAQAEFSIRRPDGSERWLQTMGRLITRPDGRQVMAGVNLDITSRKEAERLRLEKELVERAIRQKSAFMARMSHELRTPVNAVLGFSQLLQGDAQEPPSARQAEQLRHIEQAAWRLLGMIDNVLELVTEPASTAVPLSEPPQPPASERGQRAGGLPVLCVEDNPVNLLLLQELLALRTELEVHCAEDGASALACLAELRPRILLLDQNLPDMTGLELLRELRRRPGLEHARFIALSADAMPQDIRDALAAGFDDYWTKPIDVPEFLRKLDEVIAALPAHR